MMKPAILSGIIIVLISAFSTVIFCGLWLFAETWLDTAYAQGFTTYQLTLFCFVCIWMAKYYLIKMIWHGTLVGQSIFSCISKMHESQDILLVAVSAQFVFLVLIGGTVKLTFELIDWVFGMHGSLQFGDAPQYLTVVIFSGYVMYLLFWPKIQWKELNGTAI